MTRGRNRARFDKILPSEARFAATTLGSRKSLRNKAQNPASTPTTDILNQNGTISDGLIGSGKLERSNGQGRVHGPISMISKIPGNQEEQAQSSTRLIPDRTLKIISQGAIRHSTPASGARARAGLKETWRRSIYVDRKPGESSGEMRMKQNSRKCLRRSREAAWSRAEIRSNEGS